MKTDAKSLKEWQKLGLYTFKTELLTLTETYREWLSQHPKGYTSTEKA